jgi:uncharacterized phage-associated protein
MKFVYKPKKAAQAAAYMVSLSHGGMDVYALIKILYLADRKCLVERGRSITTDAVVSMPLGPVLSRIYDETKAPAEIQDRYLSEYLNERENNIVSLRKDDISTDELSEYERRILEDVYEEHRHLSFADLKNLTHSLPEYSDPQGSSLPIDPAEILRQAGWSEEEIQDARMSANEEAFARALLK